MLRAVNAFLSVRSRFQIAVGSLLLVAAIGGVDFATGYELSVSIFYLLPVALCSWYAAQRAGLLLCLLSALTWLLVDDTSGHEYTHVAIPYWNAAVRLGFFFIVSYLLVRLHSLLDFLDSRAQHDGLTGLWNGRAFRERCEQLARLASRHGHPMALGYLDLVGFKTVNDRLGHGAGDDVLKAVANALGERLRASDLVARLGGDEFAILLPETDLAGARAVFGAMHERLVGVAARGRWPVGFSIGVAVFRTPPEDPDDALRVADELMYKVRQTAANSVLYEECPVQ